MTVKKSRGTASIQEEISDLTAYLAGVPEDLRKNGAFRAYEARLQALRARLRASNTSQGGDKSPSMVPLVARGND